VRRTAAALAVAYAVFATGAPAQEAHVGVTAGVSRDSYMISSTFTGTEIVVFGGLEASEGGVLANRQGLDVAIVVFGPEENITVRRKQPVAGIWINRSAEKFQRMPGFYYAAATAPFETLAEPAVLASRGIGLTGMTRPVRPSAKPYLDAILRQKQQQQLYSERATGVTFLSSSVFRATIPLPAQVPIGTYTIKVFAFKDRQLAGGTSVPFAIDKTGLERWTFEFANRFAWLYATAAVLSALLAGFLASWAFRERG
jgi:uncharacterized protein (TIGR02186 family)